MGTNICQEAEAHWDHYTKPGYSAYTWVKLEVELLLPPGFSREGTRLRSQEPSTAVLAALLMLCNDEHCNDLVQTGSCACKLVSEWRLTSGFFHPSFPHYRQGMNSSTQNLCSSSHLSLNPNQHTQDLRLRCPSFPTPKAEQRLF